MYNITVELLEQSKMGYKYLVSLNFGHKGLIDPAALVDDFEGKYPDLFIDHASMLINAKKTSFEITDESQTTRSTQVRDLLKKYFLAYGIYAQTSDISGDTLDFNNLDKIAPDIRDSIDYSSVNPTAFDYSKVTSTGQVTPKKTSVTKEVFARDINVVEQALYLADGSCELCGCFTFERPDGSVFLEVHHVLPLSKSGSDTISNVVALCPNCHREIHFGSRSKELREKLYNHISRLVVEKGI